MVTNDDPDDTGEWLMPEAALKILTGMDWESKRMVGASKEDGVDCLIPDQDKSKKRFVNREAAINTLNYICKNKESNDAIVIRSSRESICVIPFCNQHDAKWQARPRAAPNGA